MCVFFYEKNGCSKPKWPRNFFRGAWTWIPFSRFRQWRSALTMAAVAGAMMPPERLPKFIKNIPKLQCRSVKFEVFICFADTDSLQNCSQFQYIASICIIFVDAIYWNWLQLLHRSIVRWFSLEHCFTPGLLDVLNMLETCNWAKNHVSFTKQFIGSRDCWEFSQFAVIRPPKKTGSHQMRRISFFRI